MKLSIPTLLLLLATACGQPARDIIDPMEGTHIQRVVPQGGMVTQVFTFENTTGKTVAAPRIVVSCSCLSKRFEPEEIAPGEFGTVTFTRAHPGAGTERSTAFLQWEDDRVTQLEWEITALRPDSVLVWPPQVDRRSARMEREVPFVFLADLEDGPDALTGEITNAPEDLDVSVRLESSGVDRLGVTQGSGTLFFEGDLEAMRNLKHLDLDLGHQRLARILFF